MLHKKKKVYFLPNFQLEGLMYWNQLNDWTVHNTFMSNKYILLYTTFLKDFKMSKSI